MGLNFLHYDGLQPKMRAAIIYEHECMYLLYSGQGPLEKWRKSSIKLHRIKHLSGDDPNLIPRNPRVDGISSILGLKAALKKWKEPSINLHMIKHLSGKGPIKFPGWTV